MRKRISLLVIYLLLTITASYSTHVHADKRALRPFNTAELSKAKLIVRIPARPEWEMQTDQRKGTYAVLMNTPENYYPMAVMEYIYNYHLKVPEGQQKQTALSA